MSPYAIDGLIQGAIALIRRQGVRLALAKDELTRLRAELAEAKRCPCQCHDKIGVEWPSPIKRPRVELGDE
jgi:hypothetical protein